MHVIFIEVDVIPLVAPKVLFLIIYPLTKNEYTVTYICFMLDCLNKWSLGGKRMI